MSRSVSYKTCGPGKRSSTIKAYTHTHTNNTTHTIVIYDYFALGVRDSSALAVMTSYQRGYRGHVLNIFLVFEVFFMCVKPAFLSAFHAFQAEGDGRVMTVINGVKEQKLYYFELSISVLQRNGVSGNRLDT